MSLHDCLAAAASSAAARLHPEAVVGDAIGVAAAAAAAAAGSDAAQKQSHVRQRSAIKHGGSYSLSGPKLGLA